MSVLLDKECYRIKMRQTNRCSIVGIERGNKTMTENEYELIKMIRENDNPEKALMTAAVIILGFLKQHESSEVQAVASLRGHA